MAIEPRNIEVIDEATAVFWRSIPPEQRLRCGSAIRAFTISLMCGSERSAHPDWTNERIDRTVRRKLLVSCDWPSDERRVRTLKALGLLELDPA